MLQGHGTGRGGVLVRLGVFAVLLILTLPRVSAQSVELVSRADPGSFSSTPEGTSLFSSISADGRYVAFLSNAVNVVPGQQDTNGEDDVFLRDQVSGTTVLVSHTGEPASPVAANGECWGARISADGRYVLFGSQATNLVPGQIDTQGSWDLFLYDRVTRTTALVTRSSQSEKKTANAEVRRSWFPAINADGRYVVFASPATDLVNGQEDVNSGDDLFLYDRILRTNTLVSRASGTLSKTGNGTVDYGMSISADGSQILFASSAADLVPGGRRGSGSQLFLFNRVAGTMTLVSHAINAPTTGVTFGIQDSSLSADGNYAVFSSDSSELVPGFTGPDAGLHLYLYQRASGALSLVPQPGGGEPRISADGRYVAFIGGSEGTASEQSGHLSDVFLYDRVSGTVDLASRPLAATPRSTGALSRLSISADGRFVAFASEYQNLVPGQNDAPMTADVFLYDRVSRTTRLVSHRPGSSMDAAGGCFGPAEISGDGRAVGFASFASALSEGRDFNHAEDVLLYDRSTDVGEAVSLRADPSLSAGSSTVRAVSADGRYVLFESTAPNVVSNQQDANDAEYPSSPGHDVFLYDRVSRTKILVSRSASSPAKTGNTGSLVSGLSADGRYVVLLSAATDLVPGQVNVHKGTNVFLFDRVTGIMALVSHSAASPATSGDHECFNPTTPPISSDGRYIAFSCFATDLVPGQSEADLRSNVFLYDRVLGSNLLVSRAAGSAATAADERSGVPVMSADGRFIAFTSYASNLVPGQGTGSPENVFLFDRLSGTTVLVSHVPSNPTMPANSLSSDPVISADGRFVAFTSYATDLVPGNTVSGNSIYLFDRISGAVSLVTKNGESPALNADGRFVVFSSIMPDLIPGQIDSNHNRDVFLYDRISGGTALVSRGPSPTTAGNRGSSGASISADGNRIAFSSAATDLIPGFTPQVPYPFAGDVFLYHRDTGAMELISRIPASPLRPGNASSSNPVLSADGRSIAFESRATDLVVGDRNLLTDVYLYGPGGASTGPTPLTPCTLLDTRRRADRPALTSNVQRTVTVRGACGVPATAKQVVVKVTVFNPSGKGNLRFYPGAVAAAPSGMLRFERGATRAESFTLPLSPDGKLTILPFVAGKGTVHAAVEVNGYSQ